MENPKKSMSVTEPRPKVRPTSSQSKMPLTGASIPNVGETSRYVGQIHEEARDFKAVHGDKTKKDYPKDSKDILFMKCDKYPKEIPPLLKNDPKPGDHPENISLSDLIADDTEYQALARLGGGRKNLLSQEYLDMLEALRIEAQEELQRRKEKGQAGYNPDKRDRPFPFRTLETPGWIKRGRIPNDLNPLPGVNDNRFKEVPLPSPGHAAAERKVNCNKGRYGPAPYDSDNLSVWKRGVEEIKQKRSLDDKFKGRR